MYNGLLNVIMLMERLCVKNISIKWYVGLPSMKIPPYLFVNQDKLILKLISKVQESYEIE